MKMDITHVALACLLAMSGHAGCSEAAAAPPKKPVPVRVQKVERARGPLVARYSAAIEPAAQVDMAFRVGGYVESLGEVVGADGRRRAIDKGDFVQKGSVLARIRAHDYTQKVLTSRAVIAEARSEARLAYTDLERSTKLYETAAITGAEFDAKQARADAAKANVEGALAREKEASIALADTVLRAPMDGVILSRNIEVGSLVSPGQWVLQLADTRTVKAVFGAPAALVDKLAVGTSLTVYVDSESGSMEREEVRAAKVTRIAPAADALGRVFEVEAALSNERGFLRTGAVVSVHVPEAQPLGSPVAVPLSSVLRTPGAADSFSVFVLDGHGEQARARLRNVHLGVVLGNSVSVLSGLAEGERVVTVGSTLLRDGSAAIVIR